LLHPWQSAPRAQDLFRFPRKSGLPQKKGGGAIGRRLRRLQCPAPPSCRPRLCALPFRDASRPRNGGPQAKGKYHGKRTLRHSSAHHRQDRQRHRARRRRVSPPMASRRRRHHAPGSSLRRRPTAASTSFHSGLIPRNAATAPAHGALTANGPRSARRSARARKPLSSSSTRELEIAADTPVSPRLKHAFLPGQRRYSPPSRWTATRRR